jgi:DNA-binding transcriptional MerR regulator
MPKLSIADISRLTGLATHTIRYYETRFPEILSPSRSPGGHRQYSPEHLETLKKIVGMTKTNRLTLEEVHQRLVSPALEQARSQAVDMSVILRQFIQTMETLQIAGDDKKLLEEIVALRQEGREIKALLKGRNPGEEKNEY